MGNFLRRVSCIFFTLVLALDPVLAQVSAGVRARVQELGAKRSQARVSLADGTSVQGRIVRVEADSFTVLQSSGREIVLPFAKVVDVRKQAGRPRKALWIPLAIGAGVAVALCVAPYPIGFLCRSDPS